MYSSIMGRACLEEQVNNSVLDPAEAGPVVDKHHRCSHASDGRKVFVEVAT